MTSSDVVKKRKAFKSRVDAAFHFSGSNSGYCALPISGDTYRNCPSNCIYCYDRQTPNQHLRDNKIQPRDVSSLYESLFSDPQVKEFVVKRNIPVRIGALSDPFPAMESWLRNTEMLLDLMVDSDIPIQLTTKNPAGIDDGHLETLLRSNYPVTVRVSFATLDDGAAAQLEPGSPAPSERLKAMKRLADEGIIVGARLSPFIHTLGENYDQGKYDVLAAHGVKSLSIEMLKFSALWRRSWDPIFWSIANGVEMPSVYDRHNWREQVVKGKPLRQWAENQEKEYFAPLQELEYHKYHSDGYHFIYYSPRKLRDLFLLVRQRTHKAGMRFGVCSFTDGIHNIGVNDGRESPAGLGMCGCIFDPLPRDKGALVEQWHRDKWEKYLMPLVLEYGAGVAMDRFLIANDPAYRPLELKRFPTGLHQVAEAVPMEAAELSPDLLKVKGAARAWSRYTGGVYDGYTKSGRRG